MVDPEQLEDVPRGSGGYHADLTATLEAVWKRVLNRRAPQVANWFTAGTAEQIPVGAEAAPFLQAMTIWFQLSRIVDENAEIYRRRRRETDSGAASLSGSFAKALEDTRPTFEEFAAASKALRIGPTLTAHPTESKRVTVLEIHRRIYRHLTRLETDRWTPRERSAILDEIECEVELLWLTGELRLDRPSLSDEINWGLKFFEESIFDAVPQLFESFENATKDHFEDALDRSSCLRFHSWIGGDRDGNPNVTHRETKIALERGRAHVRELYTKEIRAIAERLSISDFMCDLPSASQQALNDIIDDQIPSGQNPNEIFRRALSAVKARLLGDGYSYVGQFRADLQTVYDALVAVDAKRLADKYIRRLIWQVSVFGFRTVTLDIRQNSAVTTAAISEIWGQEQQVVPAYGTPEWSARLQAELSNPSLPDAMNTKLSAKTKELLDLFALIHDVKHGPDSDAIGPFILSMTRSTDDLLGIYLLARYAGFGAEMLDLTVVPLFETIDDLQNAPKILSALLVVPFARRSLRARGQPIEVMLGYSDSNKDGGFICSVRELDRAQRKITQALANKGFEVSFFHGRGGSVSRGGAPTGRAIAAQPAGTISGPLRVTEQGEVVSANYANRGTAAAHLELLASSALQHSLTPKPKDPDPEFDDALAALSDLSKTAFTMFQTLPGFVDYFVEASPVEELAELNIGSRPARRFGEKSLADLRAIPWVFGWSQNRHLITGWYGAGSALSTFRRFRGEDGDDILKAMFERSELFRLIVDEMEKSLYQTDLEIGAHYAALVSDEQTRKAVFGAVEKEYALAVAEVKFLAGGKATAERFPDFCEQFDDKRLRIERANTLQIALLRESRAPANEHVSRVPLLLSINTISAGLGWTG